MGHTKVFVGNLSFKTREADLASEFTSAGKVVSANIITRGARSLGYGFVELESEEEAQKAVTLMNKKSIDSREINVELAKPRDETKLAERKPPPIRGRGRGRGRGGFGGRVRRYRPRNQVGEPGAQPTGGPPPPRRGRGGAPRPFPRQPNNRIPSETTLFVANLPFSLDNQGLAALFKDLRCKNAHVVITRTGRSKGFGFVEFENKADQEAALIVSEKFVVENRKLIVKVALTENPQKTDQNEKQETNKDQVETTPTITEEKKPTTTAE